MADDQGPHQVSQRRAIVFRDIQSGNQAIVQLHANVCTLEDELGSSPLEEA